GRRGAPRGAGRRCDHLAARRRDVLGRVRRRLPRSRRAPVGGRAQPALDARRRRLRPPARLTLLRPPAEPLPSPVGRLSRSVGSAEPLSGSHRALFRCPAEPPPSPAELPSVGLLNPHPAPAELLVVAGRAL